MSYKSIEVYYDIADIPGCDGSNPMDPKALPFRDAAMELIASALKEHRLGQGEGAEIGMGEINIGFEVLDTDEAQDVVWDAVEGTPYEGIREIAVYNEDLDAA
jgi:hypothetical protein